MLCCVAADFCALLLGIVLTTPIAISSFASTETLSFTPDNINADISLGTLSGKTKERVYLAEEGGRKVSQLDWKFNNAAIIKGAINWDLMPQISIGAAGWTTLGSRGGNMVDQDWMDSSNPGTWTDESRHPDTQLNYANEFDLNIKGWLLNEPNYRLGLMAGAGVRAENLHHFLDAGVLEVHSSAGAWQASPMRYRNQGLSMSSDEHADEYSRYIVDGAAVAEMKGIIERHQAK